MIKPVTALSKVAKKFVEVAFVVDELTEAKVVTVALTRLEEVAFKLVVVIPVADAVLRVVCPPTTREEMVAEDPTREPKNVVAVIAPVEDALERIVCPPIVVVAKVLVPVTEKSPVVVELVVVKLVIKPVTALSKVAKKLVELAFVVDKLVIVEEAKVGVGEKM